jgi:hypothetical protein
VNLTDPQPESPRLSVLKRTNFVGTAACGFSIGSADCVLRLVRLLRSYAEYAAEFPYSVSGGTAFAMNFGAVCGTLIVLGLGFVALKLLLTSLSAARREEKPTVTWTHIGAGLFLMPACCVLIIFISRIALQFTR